MYKLVMQLPCPDPVAHFSHRSQDEGRGGPQESDCTLASPLHLLSELEKLPHFLRLWKWGM